jgi:MFS family permease
VIAACPARSRSCNAYPSADAWACAVAIWAAAGGTAVAAGPVLGGVLLANLGWRAIFLINLLVGAAALAVTIRRVPSVAAATPGLVLPGRLSASAALGSRCLPSSGPGKRRSLHTELVGLLLNLAFAMYLADQPTAVESGPGSEKRRGRNEPRSVSRPLGPKKRRGFERRPR